MRKNRYHCKRYFLPVPKAIGDLLDAKVDYATQLFDPAIVYIPQGEKSLSHLDKLEDARRENTLSDSSVLTGSLRETSRTIEHNN
jgi:hypothetical protein